MKNTKSLFWATSVALGLALTTNAQTDNPVRTGGNGNGNGNGTNMSSNGGSMDRIGDMRMSKFNKINAKGNRMVMAIKPTSGAATEADKQLMMQMAMGGMRQLMVSQAVAAKATTPEIKMLAQSEVEEQTGVSNKLKEIAAAKGVMLPTTPDAETQALVARAQSLSGRELDMFYLDESGIKGHQLLQSTMTTVSASANDRSLRKLAVATLLVIRMHLEVSQEERGEMNGRSTAAR